MIDLTEEFWVQFETDNPWYFDRARWPVTRVVRGIPTTFWGPFMPDGTQAHFPLK